MRRVFATLALTLVVATGCSTPPTRQQIGVGAGAALGGVAGYAVTGGPLGTAIGAAAGGLLGNEIGKDLDQKKK